MMKEESTKSWQNRKGTARLYKNFDPRTDQSRFLALIPRSRHNKPNVFGKNIRFSDILAFPRNLSVIIRHHRSRTVSLHDIFLYILSIPPVFYFESHSSISHPLHSPWTLSNSSRFYLAFCRLYLAYSRFILAPLSSVIRNQNISFTHNRPFRDPTNYHRDDGMTEDSQN